MLEVQYHEHLSGYAQLKARSGMQKALSLINILGLAALVALGKVIAQMTKAATANPVDVLRSE